MALRTSWQCGLSPLIGDVRRLKERLRTDGLDRRYWLVYHRMQAVLARGEGEVEATRQQLDTAAELR